MDPHVSSYSIYINILNWMPLISIWFVNALLMFVIFIFLQIYRFIYPEIFPVFLASSGSFLCFDHRSMSFVGFLSKKAGEDQPCGAEDSGSLGGSPCVSLPWIIWICMDLHGSAWICMVPKSSKIHWQLEKWNFVVIAILSYYSGLLQATVK